MLEVLCIALSAVSGAVIMDGLVFEGIIGLFVSTVFMIGSMNKRKSEYAR